MKKSFFDLFFLGMLVCSCSSQKAATHLPINQGITGYVKKISGNQMPSPDIKPSQPKAMKATVCVYEVTNINQVIREGASPFYAAVHSRFVDSVATDASGHFLISLPEGSYSLFIKVNGKFFANSFDGTNNIAVAAVKKNSLTQVDLLMNAGAYY